MSRRSILESLLAQITPGGVFRTTGRRLRLWNEVTAQPALFVRHVADFYPPRPTRMPVKATLNCEAWIYSQGGADPDAVPDDDLNDLLDLIELQLRPPPGKEAQTLGGAVTHCWIEGTVEIHPGDLDGQAIAIMPIRILVPSLNGG